MTSMEKLLTEALALPEDERARLAHELLLSLAVAHASRRPGYWQGRLRDI